MNPNDAQNGSLEAQRAHHKKLGLRMSFIALGFLVLNIAFVLGGNSILSNEANGGSNLLAFQVSEVLNIGLAIFGIAGIAQLNKAAKVGVAKSTKNKS